MGALNVGDRVTCAETGKEFTIARDEFTYNYARDKDGNIYSNEGVDIRERRALLDRSKPFHCYISGDGKHATGWGGNILGTVTRLGSVELTRMSYTHGRYMNSYHVRDVHGGEWYGRGSPGVCITLRPYKNR